MLWLLLLFAYAGNVDTIVDAYESIGVTCPETVEELYSAGFEVAKEKAEELGIPSFVVDTALSSMADLIAQYIKGEITEEDIKEKIKSNLNLLPENVRKEAEENLQYVDYIRYLKTTNCSLLEEYVEIVKRFAGGEVKEKKSWRNTSMEIRERTLEFKVGSKSVTIKGDVKKVSENEIVVERNGKRYRIRFTPQELLTSDCEDIKAEERDDGIYYVGMRRKEKKLLWIFPVVVEEKIIANAETGEKKIEKPWWSFLAFE